MGRDFVDLDRLVHANPCQEDWSAMPGNDVVRHCDKCGQNVYNLSGMTRGEAQRVIRRHEGRLCARFYRRGDGRIQTRLCPSGLRKSLGWAARRAATFGFALPAFAHEDGSCSRSTATVDYRPNPTGSAGIRVFVTDAFDSPIPVTEIALWHVERGDLPQLLKTDSRGYAEFDGIEGVWNLTVGAAGFYEYRRDGFRLNAGEVAELHVRLALGIIMGDVSPVGAVRLSEPFRTVVRWFRRLAS